jgi:hypothetical protein
MKHSIASAFAVVALILVLTFPVTVPAARRAKNPLPSTAAALAPEPHPEIREAIAALRRARGRMDRAAHDFGGHRVEALRATDEAIRQLQICLKYDE